MARLALINPPATMKQRYGALATAGSRAAPLGLCALAAAVRQAGHDVAIVDCTRTDHESAMEQVSSYRPDVIGITAATLTVSSAAHIARQLADVGPVIIGGPHVSAVPLQTLSRYPQFSAAVVGEGERTILRLLSLSANDNINEIPRVITSDSSRMTDQDSVERITDLDNLPFPAFDLLPGFPADYRPQTPSVHRLPSVSLVTSRGCPGRCTFCSNRVFGRRVAFHSARYVVDMMDWLHKEFGINDIQFEDDCFTLNRHRVVELCRLLRKKQLNISWSCLARVDQLDSDLMAEMRSAGCWSIHIGIESGHSTILDRMHKSIDLQQVGSVITSARACSLRVKGFIMIGCPGETPETLTSTEQLLLNSDLSDIGICYFTPYPGTTDHERCPEEGTMTDDWDRMSGYEITFVPAALTASDLQHWYRRIWRKFYFRPRIMIDYLRRVSSWQQFRGFLQGFIALLRMWR